MFNKTIFLRLISFICLAIFIAKPALAFDSRIIQLYYNDDKIYSIQGKMKIQTTIIFGEGERIENIAIGDGTAWQITPNKKANLLFLKPLMENNVTNMTVVTNMHIYLFELSSVKSSRNAAYTIKFNYPKPIEEPLPKELVEFPANALSTNYSVEPSKLNFNWAKIGDKDILPSEIFDDGVLTYIKWPMSSLLPAIFAIDANGVESLINSRVQNDYFVIDHVPQSLVLKFGQKQARLNKENGAQ